MTRKSSATGGFKSGQAGSDDQHALRNGLLFALDVDTDRLAPHPGIDDATARSGDAAFDAAHLVVDTAAAIRETQPDVINLAAARLADHVGIGDHRAPHANDIRNAVERGRLPSPDS